MTEKGLTLASATNQILTVVTIFFGKPLKESLGGYTFILCAAFSLLAGLFCLFYLKETKGLSEKEVARLYVPTEHLAAAEDEGQEKLVTNLDDTR